MSPLTIEHHEHKLKRFVDYLEERQIPFDAIDSSVSCSRELLPPEFRQYKWIGVAEDISLKEAG